MSGPTTCKPSSDPAWRRERARKGGLARTRLDYHIRAIVARAGKLTPDQVTQLRSLLPDPASCGLTGEDR